MDSKLVKWLDIAVQIPYVQSQVLLLMLSVKPFGEGTVRVDLGIIKERTRLSIIDRGTLK